MAKPFTKIVNNLVTSINLMSKQHKKTQPNLMRLSFMF